MSDHEQVPKPVERDIWMRALLSIVLFVLLRLADTVLLIVTIVQWFWMLIKKERHPGLQTFGRALGEWLATTARYQAGASDRLPFPWSPWGQ